VSLKNISNFRGLCSRLRVSVRFMITGVTSKRGHRSSVKNNSKSNTIRFHDRIKELLLLSEERYKNNEKHKYILIRRAQSALV
jgi:hypothetical protein